MKRNIKRVELNGMITLIFVSSFISAFVSIGLQNILNAPSIYGFLPFSNILLFLIMILFLWIILLDSLRHIKISD